MSDLYDFEDIRPYRDDEVREVLDRLSTDVEFLDVLVKLKLPWLESIGSAWGIRLGRWLVSIKVKRLFTRIHSVAELQQLIGEQLRVRLKTASSGITVRGLEKLKRGRACLFISNHRDIAMDPAVVNLALDDAGFDTFRIAIGDNLLAKPFASDLMRLNKSFIVKRSPSSRREKLADLKQLSAYIRHSILVDNSSIWIAQSEGRAKDGIDKTETAMLKMLALSKEKQQNFTQALVELNIVAVSISYELDPCDSDKTRELNALRLEGNYQKAPFEDLKSIYEGIVGNKGRIAVTFGDPLQGDFETADELAAILDQQIIENYRLQPNHWFAYARLHDLDPDHDSEIRTRLKDVQADFNELSSEQWLAKQTVFDQRLTAIPPAEQDIFLAMYANPVERYLSLQNRQNAGAGSSFEGEKNRLRKSIA